MQLPRQAEAVETVLRRRTVLQLGGAHLDALLVRADLYLLLRLRLRYAVQLQGAFAPPPRARAPCAVPHRPTIDATVYYLLTGLDASADVHGDVHA